MHSATICSVELDPKEPDSPISKTEGSKIFRTSDEMSEMMTVDPDDWRTPLVYYLENPEHIVDKRIRCQALKYVMIDNTLYH
jgi:hypothetical protein